MISIMTLNLRLETVSDRAYSFMHRKDGLLRFMRAKQPDAMGFQEMTDEMLAVFREGLPGYGLVGVRNRPKWKGEYTTIAYREETLALEETGTFWLSATPDKVGTRFTIQSPEPRTCTWARLRHRATGQRFYYFNTHLDHLSPFARAKGLMVILLYIAQLRDEEPLPCFLGGDMNFTPRSSVYRYALHGDPAEPGMVDLTADVRTTFHWFGRMKRGYKLDYFFADAETAQGTFAARAIRNDLDGAHLSDHDALWLDWHIPSAGSAR